MNFYDMSTLLQGFFPVVVTFVICVLWFARLEYKTQADATATGELEKRVKNLEVKSDSIEDLKKTVTAIDAKLTVLIPNYTGRKD